jgi:succinate--hydroxymethylglutarate CoA-transferase
MTTEATSGALSGTRVLDLTRVLAGPLCTMMLGDMGAEVVKVESPGGDDTRTWGPPFVDGEAAYFLGCNRNKRSVMLDLSNDAGQQALRKLIAWADVLVDNYKVGTLARWGLTDEWFEENAPQLIRCSITGYGSTGPKASLPGYDFILQAESGLMSICGEPDGAPMKYGVAIVDLTTGMLACNAVLAAMQARIRTGRGQKTEVSLYESGLFLLANVASNYLATGRKPGRYGNGHPNIVPYTTYSASDGMIAVAVGNDAQFAKFSAALGHREWASSYPTNAERVSNRDVIDSAVVEAMARESAAHWVKELTAIGIPVGHINSVDQALTAPQCEARKMVQSLKMESGASVSTLGFPIKFSETPSSIRRCPPKLGEHTDEVLQELGISDASGHHSRHLGKG